MAALLLGNLGSSLLGPLGGFIGSAIGSFIDNLLFAPKPPDIEGPRIQDLSAVKADPGVPIPIVYGADRVPGIVIDSTDIIETKHKKKVGGKGGPRQTQITYTYHVDIDFMLCEGPILGVGRIWADGSLVRGTRYEMELRADENEEKIGAIPYPGWYLQQYYDENQLPWSLDPSFTPSLSAQKYTYNSDDDLFETISDVDADAALASSTDMTVIYAEDTDTGYYIPVPASHDYTGEKVTDCQTTPNYNDVRSDLPSFNERVDGDSDEQVYANHSEVEVVDLGATVNNGYLEWAATVTSDYDGASSRFSLTVDFLDEDDVPISSGSAPQGQDFVNETQINSSPHDVEVLPDGGVASVTETVRWWVPPNARKAELTWKRGTFLGYPGDTYGDFSSTLTLVGQQTSLPICANVRNWTDYSNLYDAINDWSPRAVLEFHGAENVTFYRGTDDQVSDPTMQLVHDDETDCDVPAYIGRAHIVFQRLELERFGNRIPNLTFEVVQSDNARIRFVISDLMARAEISEDLYDITALPETTVNSHILGYTISRVTSFRAAMEPLLEAFDVDCAEMGNQLVFRPRKRSFDHTIDYNDLAAVKAGEKPGEPITLVFRDQVEMPKRLTIRYRDPEREYQVNTAVAARQFTNSVQESGAEISAVLPSYIAKRYVRDKLRSLWLERKSAQWTTPHKYLYVSPSDRVFINGSDYGKTDFVMKVTSVSRAANGILSMEGVVQELTLYEEAESETDAIGTDTFFGAQVGGSRTPVTYMHLLNLPPLREEDNNAGFYYGLSGQTEPWLGGVLVRQLTSQSAFEEQGVLTNGTTMGVTQTALGFTATPGVLDTVNTVTVKVYNETETLSSITADELLNTKLNTAVIGTEIIRFMTVEDLGNGQWRLSNLVRGLLDTDDEDTLSSHLQFERFVLLEDFTVGDSVTPLSEAFNPYTYKGVTVGSQISQHPPATFTNEATRLRPFKVYGITGERDGSNNLTISWIRQDRLSYQLVDGIDIPVSEDYEQYEVDIVSGGTVLRTFVVDNATEVEYTAANQTTDGLTPGDPVNVRIYQMSAIIGRGKQASGVV